MGLVGECDSSKAICWLFYLEDQDTAAPAAAKQRDWWKVAAWFWFYQRKKLISKSPHASIHPSIQL